MPLIWISGPVLAGPVSPTLELLAQEAWQTSSIVHESTVITSHSVSSGIVIDTAHTGRVTFSTASGHGFGTFSSLAVTGLGYPLIGAGLFDEVDLSAQVAPGKASNVVAGSATLTLWLTETGLTTDLGRLPFDAAIGGTISTGAAVTYKTYVDPADDPFGESVPLTNSASLTGNPFAWSSHSRKLLQ
ncbi:MAG: hypothetical protein ACREF3_01705, partial [Acetobacteraceae bacterium]